MAGLLSTRDGVTVAQEVVLGNPEQNLGAALLKVSCTKVNEEVGDGTTTTAILAAEIIKEGQRLIATGVEPMQLCRGIREAGAQAETLIRALSSAIQTPEQIARVATLASNNDAEVADGLATAAMAIGKDGTIVIEDGYGTGVTLECKEGMELDRGPLHGGTDFGEIVKHGPLVAVVGQDLTSWWDIKEILEEATQWQPRPLLLFALNVAQEAMASIILNSTRKGLIDCTAIRCPGYGHHRKDYLRDIAALSGAAYVSKDEGLEHKQWKGEWFGALKQVSIHPKTTTLIPYEDHLPKMREHLDRLRREADTAASDFDRDQIRRRMASLSGGLAVLKVGGVTEAERKDRRARVEDALAAVRAALKGGIVPGGGSAYLQASLKLLAPTGASPAIQVGWGVLGKALGAPLQALVHNAGGSGEVAIDRLIERWAVEDNGWLGWDVLQGRVRDLAVDPVVMDPTLVAVCALRAAVSVATMLLSVEVSITRTK